MKPNFNNIPLDFPKSAYSSAKDWEKEKGIEANWNTPEQIKVKNAYTKEDLENMEHLNYAARLAEGRSIGSGQAEGACKQMIGRRLKQTGARWRVRRVNRMAALSSLIYSDLWSKYWANAF